MSKRHKMKGLALEEFKKILTKQSAKLITSITVYYNGSKKQTVMLALDISNIERDNRYYHEYSLYSGEIDYEGFRKNIEGAIVSGKDHDLRVGLNFDTALKLIDICETSSGDLSVDWT